MGRGDVDGDLVERVGSGVDRGGHFAALEEPAALTEEVRAFFRDLR